MITSTKTTFHHSLSKMSLEFSNISVMFPLNLEEKCFPDVGGGNDLGVTEKFHIGKNGATKVEVAWSSFLGLPVL